MNREPAWPGLSVQDDLWRQALSVSLADQAGILDGVQVDFRHADLPPGKWEPPIGWHTWQGPLARFRQSVFPFVLPFEHAKGDDELAAAVFGPTELTKVIRIFAGEMVTVHHVDTVSIDDREFDDRDEQSMKYVYLKVRRHDGTEEIAPTPLLFLGCSNVREHAAYSRDIEPHLRDVLVYEKLASRIERNFEDFCDDGPILRLARHSDFAKMELDTAQQGLVQILGLLDEVLATSDGLMRRKLQAARVSVVQIASHAMQAGYNLARDEMSIAAKRAKGQGKGLAHRSRDKTPDNRLELAAAYWQSHPNAALTKVASWIVTQLAITNEDAPGESQVRSSIVSAHSRVGIIPKTSPSYSKYPGPAT